MAGMAVHEIFSSESIVWRTCKETSKWPTIQTIRDKKNDLRPQTNKPRRCPLSSSCGQTSSLFFIFLFLSYLFWRDESSSGENNLISCILSHYKTGSRQRKSVCIFKLDTQSIEQMYRFYSRHILFDGGFISSSKEKLAGSLNASVHQSEPC